MKKLVDFLTVKNWITTGGCILLMVLFGQLAQHGVIEWGKYIVYLGAVYLIFQWFLYPLGTMVVNYFKNLFK